MDNQQPSHTILITGANQGLGLRLSELLAAQGHRVLMHGRDSDRLEHAAHTLRNRHPDADIATYLADLSDLDEVRNLADAVARREPRLHVLINNAACGGGTDPSRRQTSRQGHELRLAVNHLAPLLLTWELRTPLTAAQPARVIQVASLGQSPMDFGDPMFTHDYDGVEAYCRSKLAMISTGFTLAEQWRETGVTVNSIHPAHLMDTTMVADSGFTPIATIDDGAAPVMRLVTDPALTTVTGRYFAQFDDAPAHRQAYDRSAREQLWELSWKLIDQSH